MHCGNLPCFVSAITGLELKTLVTGGSGFIGTNLVDALLGAGREVLSLDVRPPRKSERAGIHRAVDVLDPVGLRRVFEEFRPDEVVHLAARTDFSGRADPDGYRVNTEGTSNVLAAVARCPSVARLIHASSNVVPREDEPPAGTGRGLTYEASKTEAERILRASGLACDWCVVRPCFVWGPWLGPPFCEFFLAIARGRYFHLGRINPPKLHGYVGNVVFQIVRLLEAPGEQVRGEVFYLADYEPTTVEEWSKLIARKLGRPAPRRLPEPLVRAAAWSGDLLGALGYGRAPLTSTRLKHMRTDTTDTPIETTRRVAGRLPFTLEQGVDETIAWLRQEGLVR